MLLCSFHNLKALEHIQDFALCIKLIDWRVFLFILIFSLPVMKQIHPGWLAVEMRDYRPPARFEHPSAPEWPAECLLWRATRVCHTASNVLSSNGRFKALAVRTSSAWTFSTSKCRRVMTTAFGSNQSLSRAPPVSEIPGCHSPCHSRSPAMFALQDQGLAFNAFHYPWELVGFIHGRIWSKNAGVPGSRVGSVTY